MRVSLQLGNFWNGKIFQLNHFGKKSFLDTFRIDRWNLRVIYKRELCGIQKRWLKKFLWCLQLGFFESRIWSRQRQPMKRREPWIPSNEFQLYFFYPEVLGGVHIFSRIVLASAKLNKHQIRFYCNLENKTNHPGIFHLLAPRQALPIIPTESRLKIYFRTDNPILSFVSILFSALPTTVLRYPVCKFFCWPGPLFLLLL